jgi:quinol monooxygenase YgiN
MFAIFFHALAKPGKRQDLLDFLKRDSKFCKEHEPGTLTFDILPDPKNDNAFYVYEAYEDCAAFVEHQGNPLYIEWEPNLKNELVAEFTEIFEGKPLCSSRAGRV